MSDVSEQSNTPPSVRQRGEAFARYQILPNIRRTPDLEFRLRGLVWFSRSVVSELRTKYRLPFKQRLRAWKHRFSSRSWVIYNLTENDPKLYLSDFIRGGMYRINGIYNPILGNKLILSRLLAAHDVPHPAVISTVRKGRLHSDVGFSSSDLRASLSNTLHQYPRQVFRPIWSGAGEGVFFLHRNEPGLLLNGVPATLEEVADLVSGLDHYMATTFEDQAVYARKIYPGSPNTLRVLTLWDHDEGKPFVAAAVHRFGSSRSAPIDNWHQGHGGVCAAIDQEAGTLGRAVALTSANQLAWHSAHPETKEAIDGVAIPGLASCFDGLVAAASHFPHCPFVGWDVLLTEEGFKILEANTVPGMWVWQVHKPLLADERTRRFFLHYGLVRS